MTEESAQRAEVIKHLEFIQNIIDRMGRNSIFFKGTSLTIVASVLVFMFRVEGEESNALIIASALIVAVIGVMDGYLLWKERLFIRLYDKVRLRNSTDFSMQFSKEILNIEKWSRATRSPTIMIYYGAEIIIVLTPFFI